MPFGIAMTVEHVLWIVVQILELDYVTHLRPDCHGEAVVLRSAVLPHTALWARDSLQVMPGATFTRFLARPRK